MTAILMKGQYNSYASDTTLRSRSPFRFDGLIVERSLGNAMIEGGTLKKAATENELAFQVKEVVITDVS